MLNRILTSLVLVTVLACGAMAAVDQWTNAAGNGSWMDPNNWSLKVLPGPGVGNTQINPSFVVAADANTPKVGPTIRVGEFAVTDAADVWGPEFGPLSFNVEGGSYVSPAFVGLVSVSSSEATRVQTNVGANSSGGWFDVKNLLIGDSWWWHDGPYATFNQWSGTSFVRDWLWLGGKLNLYGGTMYVFNGVSMASVGQSPTLCTLNIEGGTLFLPTGSTATVQGWITAGYCVAYKGTGQIVIQEVGGRTKVTATAPVTGSVPVK